MTGNIPSKKTQNTYKPLMEVWFTNCLHRMMSGQSALELPYNTSLLYDIKKLLLILPSYFLTDFTESFNPRLQTDLAVATEANVTSGVTFPSRKRYLPQSRDA